MNIYKDWADSLLQTRLSELEAIVNSDVDISVAEYRDISTSLKEQYDSFVNSIDNNTAENNMASVLLFLFDSAYQIAEFLSIEYINMDKPDLKLDDEFKKKYFFLYYYSLAFFYHFNVQYSKAIDCWIELKSLNYENIFKELNFPYYEIDSNLALTYASNEDFINTINILENLSEYFMKDKCKLDYDENFGLAYLLNERLLNIVYGNLENFNLAINSARKVVHFQKNWLYKNFIDYQHLLVIYQKALYKGITIYEDKNEQVQYDITAEFSQTMKEFQLQLYSGALGIKEQNDYRFIHFIILARNREVTQKFIKQNIKIQTSQQIEHVECLYQYKSTNSAKKAIINQTIYLNNPSNFNDYTDPFYRLFDDEYSKMAYSEAMGGLGIACLTTKNANLLMWSHYADSHRGVCIKYKMPSTINNDMRILSKVSYTNKRIIMTGEVIGNTRVNKNDNPVSFVEQLSTKSREWKYEDEYRIIGWNDKENDREIDAEIEAVYMGKEISKEDEKTLKMLAKEYHFDLYKMKTNPSNLRSLKAELMKC